MIQILKAVDLCRVHRPGKDLQDYVQEASFNSLSCNWVNLFLFPAGTHICFSTLHSCSQVVTLSQSMILNTFFGRVIWWQLKLLSFYVFFSFLFIALELTTWPANNCLETSVLLLIIFCSCAIETHSCVKMADHFPAQAENHFTYLVDQNNGDRMMKQ